MRNHNSGLPRRHDRKDDRYIFTIESVPVRHSDPTFSIMLPNKGGVGSS